MHLMPRKSVPTLELRTRSEKLPRVEWISIVDQIALPREKTINGIGQIACDLNHPQSIR